MTREKIVAAASKTFVCIADQSQQVGVLGAFSLPIEVIPLAYKRGRTLNDAFVILDEAQNSTMPQMQMFLTRLGFNSRTAITGDITQIDLANREMSGLVKIQDVLAGIDGIKFVYLTESDVVRHRLVREIVKAFDRYARSSKQPDASHRGEGSD